MRARTGRGRHRGAQGPDPGFASRRVAGAAKADVPVSVLRRAGEPVAEIGRQLVGRGVEDEVGGTGRQDPGVLIELGLELTRDPGGEPFDEPADLLELAHDGFAEADPHPACFSCTEADLNDADTLSARAALRWIPNNAFTFDLAADVTQKDALPIARRLAFYDASPMLDPLFFLPGGYAGAVMSGWGVGPEAFVNREENTHSSNFAGEDDQSIWGVSATAEWEGEHLTLRSITGYRELDIDHAADGDGSPLALNTVVAETTDQDQFSQEFQLLGTTADGRLDWLAGAFYFEETATNAIAQALTFTEAGQIVPAPPPNPPMVIDCFDASAPPLFGCPARPTLVSSLDVTNYAVFAHASFALTDQVSVSAGLRYSDEEKDFTGADANGAPLDLSDSWDALTPSLTLEWAPSETLFFYASYSEGFKSGTFNNGNDPAQPRSVTPEEVEAYEVGARASWLDGDLTLSLAAFDNTYTGQQLQVPTSNFTFAFVNVASSEIQGLELEFAARPHETLTIDGSVGYLDTEITDVLVGTPGVREGARLVRSPEWTFNAGFTFETSIGSLGRMQLRGDYIYRTEQEGDFTNHPNVRTDAYSTVNARLAYVPPNERLEFALWGRNVFDQSYESARASIAPQLFAVAVDGPPRVWGVSASVRY